MHSKLVWKIKKIYILDSCIDTAAETSCYGYGAKHVSIEAIAHYFQTPWWFWQKERYFYTERFRVWGVAVDPGWHVAVGITWAVPWI